MQYSKVCIGIKLTDGDVVIGISALVELAVGLLGIVRAEVPGNAGIRPGERIFALGVLCKGVGRAAEHDVVLGNGVVVIDSADVQKNELGRKIERL